MMTALCFYAAQQSTEAMGVNHSFNHSVYMSDDTVPLKTKGNSKNKDEKPSNPNSPIMVPEITLDGRTIHFVTPCMGLTFRLVQEDEVCYETEITSDVIEIPQNYVGAYELQILRGDYIFYADIELD